MTNGCDAVEPGKSATSKA